MKSLSASILVCLVVTSTTMQAADWPQWRGPNRDGISKETGLLQEWPEGGPAIRWKATGIGSGYSSPAVVGGRVYLQTTRGSQEFALALDEQTGEEIWSVLIGNVGENRGPQYPGTRSTPTVDGDRMYCLASDGQLSCLDSTSGDVKWQTNLQQDFNGKPGQWAYTESVLIDGSVVVCTPGGESAAIAALDKNSGETIWKSAVPDGGTAEYSSAMIVEDGGTKQYVQFLRNGIVGVEADTGTFLWIYGKTAKQPANILTPIVQGNRVFSSGSRSGGALLELTAQDNRIQSNEVYFDRTFGPGIGGAVLIDGYLYGTKGGLMCADFETGKVVWTDRAIGDSSLCFADGRIYARTHNNADVTLIEPSPEGFRERGRFKQADRSESRAWPHPVVSNGSLYLRDQDVCFVTTCGNEFGGIVRLQRVTLTRGHDNRVFVL